MQRVSTLRNSNVPEERRHHIRRGLASSILYVELGPGNGGIIVNLGTGGLSLHAATKLNADAELALHFQLDPDEGPIETAGRVVWLGPTRKEAGISFKDLPADAERQIANWIAAQEQPVAITEGELDPQPKSPKMSGAAAPISIQGPVPASLAAERFESPQPSLSMEIPRRVVSESSQPAQFSNIASGLQRPTSPSPAIAFPTPEERFERPSDKLLRAPAKRYEVLLEPQKPAPAAQEIVPRDSLLPELMAAPAKVLEVSHQEPQANDTAASELRQRRKLGFTVAACSAGILVLMVIMTSVSRPPARRISSGRQAEPISSTATVEPVSVPQTVPEALTDQGGATTLSEDLSPEAYYDLLPILPTHLPVTVAQDGDWSTQVEAMLGMDEGTKVNPEILALPVWTVQHSGYYYCVDNLNSETPQAGALMWQGDAIQSGYRPKLGNYCN